MGDSKIVYPGTILGSGLHHKSGANTNRLHGNVISTIFGVLQEDKASGILSVIPTHTEDKQDVDFPSSSDVIAQRAERFVPAPGHNVLGRIQRVTNGVVLVEITHIEGIKLFHHMQGSIRAEEIRLAGQRSPLIDFFRPGDIIKAEIMSTADPKSYVLSALRQDHGVLQAYSETGFPLTFIENDNTAMKCTQTSVIEKRLVAMTMRSS